MDWGTLVGVAFGALLTFGFGLATRVTEKRARHDEWLRDQRLKLYGELFDAVPTLAPVDSGQPGQDLAKVTALLSIMQALMPRVWLLAPKPVKEAATEAAIAIARMRMALAVEAGEAPRDEFAERNSLEAAHGRYNLALPPLHQAMRDSLGVKD